MSGWSIPVPAPLDLAGRVFGQLTVLERGEKLGTTQWWRCRCTCGRVEDIPQHRLPHSNTTRARRDVVYACANCWQTRICVQCGNTFHAKMPRACCSDACQQFHDRQKWREDYHRRATSDPEFNKKRFQRVRERAAADLDLAEKLRVQNRQNNTAHRMRIDQDPERRARLIAYRAEYWQKNRATILASRRAAFAAMSDEQRLAYRAKYRPAWREYARRKRLEISRDPLRYIEYRLQQREAGARTYEKQQADPERRAARQKQQREAARRRALNELMRTGQELNERYGDPDESDSNGN